MQEKLDYKNAIKNDEILDENGILLVQDDYMIRIEPPTSGYGKITISFAEGKPINIEQKETTKIKYK
ncbi:DUF3954 domain-containing protein [Listeria monocytogenes]|uniref:DUF3954 domain-containing protein n=1 Tax=Listeria monocytogenes TaxID=1639 RepID=A0A823DG58_LISMN|nr:DUF3954 domain-containing protein [Listeria monocytogenes]EAD1012216.1 DUF3954 domain-containing protein [Listeria monocytogenes]EAD1186123.1 DUF3954 domain-containing protein [Listeria monocytogenes]EAF8898041.1 DUF3954 domain-containing protein [Listeria monocytogenes]EDN8811036.1 DUF3954 domain-containing protein [Listeria monocytogenes]